VPKKKQKLIDLILNLSGVWVEINFIKQIQLFLSNPIGNNEKKIKLTVRKGRIQFKFKKITS